MENWRSQSEKDEFINYHRWLNYEEISAIGDESNTCRFIKAFNNSKLVKVYGNMNRSPELRLGSSAFEHFVLYHRSDMNEACIHFTYVYG